MKRLLGLASLALILAALPARAAEPPVMRIREIRVINLGDDPLTPESVLPLLSQHPGEPFSRAAVITDTRKLLETGRFSQVEIQAEPMPQTGDLILNLALRNKPRLASLTIEGASALSNHRVADLLGLQLGDPVDDDNLAAGARKIQDEYQKKYYPHTRLTWTIRTEAKTGRANVLVQINEGRKALVSAVEIRGVNSSLEKKLREDMRMTVYRGYNPIHWISKQGLFDPDLAESEALTLRQTLLNLGYLDATVTGPETQQENKRVRLIFEAHAGAPYTLRQITLSGNTIYDENTLLRTVGIQAGDPASLARMDAAAQSVQDYYANRGYYGTRVRRAMDADPKTGRVDLRLRVEEGRMSHVRDLRIEGNQVTRDTVIRRELVIAPGDPMDQSRIQASERRLRNLGYFSDVASSVADTPEADTYDLIFRVEEGQMGLASAGVGFTSVESVSGYVEVSHGNFALGEWPPFGDGQKLRLRAQVGTRSNTIETEFIEPWFLNQRLSLGVNLFRSESRYLSDDYDQRNTGLRLSLTRALDAFWRSSVEYGLQRIELFNMSDTASALIREEEGRRVKSDLTLALSRNALLKDSRNVLPRGGNLLRLSASYAGGPLGGDTDLYELSAQGSQYVSLGWRQVLSLRARASVVEGIPGSERVPLFDRLFLGGPNSLRGFPYRGVGPKDENNTAIGGKTLAFASAEYSVPLMESIRGALFYDTGMVWADAYGFESNWNSSYGLGLRLDIPMLPIQLDYAWPLDTDASNPRKKGRFSFWIGRNF